MRSMETYLTSLLCQTIASSESLPSRLFAETGEQRIFAENSYCGVTRPAKGGRREARGGRGWCDFVEMATRVRFAAEHRTSNIGTSNVEGKSRQAGGGRGWCDFVEMATRVRFAAEHRTSNIGTSNVEGKSRRCLTHAPYSTLHTPRSMLHAPRSMLHAPCSTLHAPCSTL
jgi:hypothetical protein